MKLAELKRRDILHLAGSRQIFERGEDYYLAGQVLALNISADGATLTAKVQGSLGVYTTKISRENTGRIQTECNCPFEGPVCKHAIAALLQYIEGEFEAEEDENEEDEGEEEWEEATQDNNTGSVASPSAQPDFKVSLDLIPAVVVQTLLEMNHQELLALFLKLAQEHTEVRRALLANLVIPPQLLRQLPPNLQQVKQLKREINAFFKELEDEANYDDYDYYEDNRDSHYDHQEPGLAPVFEVTTTLNPSDQIKVYWHVLVAASKVSREYQVGGQAEIEQALNRYAQVIASLGLSHQAKRRYLENIIKMLNWNVVEYGNTIQVLKKALDLISDQAEDYRYLINLLAQSNYHQATDWQAGYYLKLGDEGSYLNLRKANLKLEAQYLDLADYWQSKGEEEKAVNTLEEWASRLVSDAPDDVAINVHVPYNLVYYSPVKDSFARPVPGAILQRLAEYYKQAQEPDKQLQILMITARYGKGQTGLNLNLYRQIEAVATGTGHWPALRQALMALAKPQPEILAQIFLYEEEWEKALELAQTEKITFHYGEALRVLVAEGLKATRPQAAIQLYQGLVDNHIAQRNRNNYRVAARYAGAIKEIFLTTLKDPTGWQTYLGGIRKTYNRLPALQDEFRKL